MVKVQIIVSKVVTFIYCLDMCKMSKGDN